MSISIDGFVSDLDGTNKWMFGSDQESKAWAVETTWNASLHIMGSRSFLAMAAFWPTSTMEFAPPMNQIPKAVFSRQGPAILGNKTAALNDARANGTGHLRSHSPARGWAEAWRAVTWRRKSRTESLRRSSPGGIKLPAVSSPRDWSTSLPDCAPVALGKGLPLFSDLPAPRPPS
jgi:hypothetical protein